MRSILRLPCKHYFSDLLEDPVSPVLPLFGVELDLLQGTLKNHFQGLLCNSCFSDGFPCGEPMRACWA